MRITVLKRGGLSVYGGSYDPKRNIAKANTTTQQTVEIVFPSTITALSITEDGIDASVPVIFDGSTKAAFTMSGSGSLTCVATMGDERPEVVIEAESISPIDYRG